MLLLCTLMLGHLRHTAILAALVLLLHLLIVHGLLLFWGHAVAGVGRRSRDTSGGRWHRGDFVGGGNIISGVDTIFISRGLGCVQAGLNEILAFGLGNERLQFWGGKGVHETSL